MKLKILLTYLITILGVMISILLSGCANPLLKASPDQLRQYPTDKLVHFELRHGKGFDPEVSQELARRKSEDIQYLILNATSLEDFEYIRYPFQTETIASKIHDKYTLSIDSNMFKDARRQWYINTNPDISNEIRECILNSKSQYDYSLKLGMTKDQVAAAIGTPDDINRSSGSWGVREQWVYGGMIGNRYFPSRYFYFTNGRLTGIQD